ncbi:IclR family transcriptional regulator [Salinisphaera aquimarina]|uniref:IclR family transcriptional regulator n=1 Tax=Salinisphaera aquimarina TaxID=2094031 RepID=A0ABV7ENB5_9GAMM
MQSVERTVLVLKLLSEAGNAGTRVTDVSKRLDLHKASASRLMTSLVALGVIQRRSDRRFRLADGFFATLGSPHDEAKLKQAARASLARISDEMGDTSFLSVRHGFDSVCIERHVGTYPIQALSLHIGSRRPLGVGAGSLSLLAWLQDVEREAALKTIARRLEDYPGIDVERIRAHAELARRENFVNLPNFVIPGMTGMGVPVRNAHGMVVAALSVAAVGDRLAGMRCLKARRILLEESATMTQCLADDEALPGYDLGSMVEPELDKQN